MEKGRTFHDKRPGGSLSLLYNYAFVPERLAIHLELGYKAKGFLPGESLRASPLAKFALNARF